jgi:hypothetical protein
VGRLRLAAARVGIAATLALATPLATAPGVAAFDGFGELRAESSYGEQMGFSVDLKGPAPELLEILLRTPGVDADFVAEVAASGGSATYVWDTAAAYVAPNTPVTYQWRATDGDEVTLSAPAVLRYTDDRPGLDWQTDTIGDATVHWYGGAATQARRFGELTAAGVDRAEELLGTTLAGPVDIFVYESREDFFGALGPAAREWTGAAAFPELRTVFMWLGGGAAEYLDMVLVHEVTHVVFHDATDNPYHEPATWLNEGIAVWSQAHDVSQEAAVVEAEAATDGLLAFDALTGQFPIEQRGGLLAYAQGATLIDMIIDDHGPAAIARIAAAYRAGASDEEALEAGTGVPADELYAAYFDAFGAEQPRPVEPEPILPSNVERPPSVDGGGGPVATPAVDPAAGDTPGDGSGAASPLVVGGAVAILVVLAAMVVLRRRAAGSERS